MSFQVGPKSHQELDALAKLDDVEECNADGAGTETGASKDDNENNEQNSDASNDQVKRKSQPPLNSKHEVEWPLRVIEQLDVLLLHSMLPSEGSQGDKSLETVGEVRVQRRLGLEIQESKLPGCAQIHLLDEEQDTQDNGERDSRIF